VRNSDAKVPFTIRIIESDEVNAFALPGGFFFLNSGLILAADSEAELAGVMAHEIAHVTARHATEQQSKGQLLNLASIPLIFVGLPPGVPQAINVAIPLTFLKFSRGMEEEADYLGLQYLYKAGYDPSAMVSFFEKLQAREKAKPGSVSTLFSTHPATADRIQKVSEAITSILPPAESYIQTTSEFDRMKARLSQVDNRLPAADTERPTMRRRTRVPPAEEPEPAPAEDDTRPTLKRQANVNPGA
jgi:predicted Zn-dependent protease